MAVVLRPCDVCKAQIASDAKNCPQCGGRQKPELPAWKVAFGLLLIAGVGSAVFAPRAPNKPAVTAAELEETARKDKNTRTVLAGANWLKRSLKKPESFELVSASMIDDKAICFEYKARNSFNDVVPGYRVITDDVNTEDPAAWNKHCAGKAGEDYTFVRAVMD